MDSGVRAWHLGWADLSHAWSKDGAAYTPDELLTHLKKIISEQACRPIPDKPLVPGLHRKALPELGTSTSDSAVVYAREAASIAAVEAAARALKTQRSRRKGSAIHISSGKGLGLKLTSHLLAHGLKLSSTIPCLRGSLEMLSCGAQARSLMLTRGRTRISQRGSQRLSGGIRTRASNRLKNALNPRPNCFPPCGTRMA